MHSYSRIISLLIRALSVIAKCASWAVYYIYTKGIVMVYVQFAKAERLGSVGFVILEMDS